MKLEKIKDGYKVDLSDEDLKEAIRLYIEKQIQEKQPQILFDFKNQKETIVGDIKSYKLYAAEDNTNLIGGCICNIEIENATNTRKY